MATEDFYPSWAVGVGKWGTYMSFLVLILGFIVSVTMQRYAPDFSGQLKETWEMGCPNGFEHQCLANSAIYRVSFALAIIFVVQMIGSYVYNKFYDYNWYWKFVIFGALTVGFYFASPAVFDLHGYAWFARIAAFFFLVLQQVILIDMAYSWNEKWTAYAAEEGDELGKKWLIGLLVISFILFGGALSAIGLMYWQFDHCDDNTAIITLTLVFSVAVTLVQLFLTEEGSVLTSALVCAYAVYVCYSAVTLNPDTDCNPTLNTRYQTLSTVIGLVLTLISLVWTTYSTVLMVPGAADASSGQQVNFTNLTETAKAAEERHAREAETGSGVNSLAGGGDADADEGSGGYSREGVKALFVQVSLVFVLISAYYAMILTNWATLQRQDDMADPRTGKAAMWIQVSGQWVAFVMYVWSLVAPNVLKNRDFSA